VAVRRPEKDTQPKLFYVGAHPATLDPLAARRPDGGLFFWSEQRTGPGHVVSGHPKTNERKQANSSAAALLAYDVAHTIPWDWRVSLYTLTKGIAAGGYLVALLLVLAGAASGTGELWTRFAPLLALVALAATGAILISDLEHPKRFWMLFARPHWKSWLVRGAWIIGGYGLVLGAHFLFGIAGQAGALRPMAWAGLPLAVLTAVYTAYLFAQAKARDLWQSALLPPHLLLQSLVAGAAALLPLAARSEPRAVPMLAAWMAIGCALHLGFVLGEVTLPHATAHARLAIFEMVRGRYRWVFATSVVAMAVATAAPWLPVPWAAGTALLGLLAFEHAYVQAGQSVPLA
jgi:formate-dependent nitrite reductase membrane component NrfD